MQNERKDKDIDSLMKNVYNKMFSSDEEFFEAFNEYFFVMDRTTLTPYDARNQHPILHELFQLIARSKTATIPRSQFEQKVLYVLSHVYYANLYKKTCYFDMFGLTPEDRLLKCKENLTDFDDMYTKITERVAMVSSH